MKSAGIAGAMGLIAVLGCQQSPSRETETQTGSLLSAAVLPGDPFTFSEADALAGKVKLTVLGVPASLDIAPVDEADQRTSGDTDKVGSDITIGLPGLEIASLRGIDDDARTASTATEISATGQSKIAAVSLLGGLVRVENLITRSTCNETKTAAGCQGTTTLARLTIAGTDIPLGDISPNTKLPVVGAISVPVAGIPVSLPVSLELTLNAQAGGSNGADDAGLLVDGLRLHGTAQSALVSLDIDITVGGPYSDTETREAPRAGFVCSLDDIANTQCLGPKDCLYPHPENCNQFIHCELNADGLTGRPTVKDCPADLEWNDNKKECDWPVDSTCPGRP